MTVHVGIVGAGLAGRLTALSCLARDWKVSLFDKDNHLGHQSCGWVAAGMLAPFTELESSELLICQLGLDSLKLWPLILEQLVEPVTLAQNGTLILAHPQDRGEQQRLLSMIDYKLRSMPALRDLAKTVSPMELQQFIPGLSNELQEGYWIAGEGHINTHEFYQASTSTLKKKGVQWYESTPATAVANHQIQTEKSIHNFDLVFDCRGLGAQKDWTGLRGVRGEVLYLHAPEVLLSCPVRMMHPRYPIYISPRANSVFVVGATSIESEDFSPISAQSMLELLSACYTVHPGFAEARIMDAQTQCRPTLVDNHPLIKVEDGLIRINGLYRHGYLIGPTVINEALTYVEQGTAALKYPELTL